MESLKTPGERALRLTRLEMRAYILEILDELHALSVAYDLDELSVKLDAARSPGGRREH